MTEIQGRDAIAHVAQMLKDIDICLFTTRGEDGELHARPMSNNRQVEWDGDSWFFAPRDGRLVAEIERDPTTVTAYKADEGYTFISLSGRAAIETDPELKKRYWLAELERWFPEGPEDSNVVLIRVDAQHAEWWGEAGDGAADLRQGAATA